MTTYRLMVQRLNVDEPAGLIAHGEDRVSAVDAFGWVLRLDAKRERPRFGPYGTHRLVLLSDAAKGADR